MMKGDLRPGALPVLAGATHTPQAMVLRVFFVLEALSLRLELVERDAFVKIRKSVASQRNSG